MDLENIVDSSIQFLFSTKNTVIPDNLKEKTPFNPPLSLDTSPHQMFPTILLISPIDYLYKSQREFQSCLREMLCYEINRKLFFDTLLVRFFQRQLRYEFYYNGRSEFKPSINIINTGISFELIGYKDKLVKFAITYIKRFFDFVSTNEYLQMFNCDISSY